MDEKCLSFLDLGTFDQDSSFRGGCLMTDMDTMPVEFRCTGSIIPTALQRTLYGRKLIEYICADLIAVPLYRAMQVKAGLVFVRRPEFLRARPELGVPIILVDKGGNGRGPLTAHPGHEGEAEMAQKFLEARRIRVDDVVEVFERVELALREAHSKKIAEKGRN